MTTETKELKLNVDFISGYVLKDSLGDCTNGGASSKYDTLYVVKPYVSVDDVKAYCEQHNEDTSRFFYVDVINVSGEYRRLRPVILKSNQANMFGGNYLCSSDSRFKEFTGIKYPIAIHDRYETWKQYNELSK